MKKNTSFTLIELLVVIVIIGVIAGVIIVTVSSSVSKANIAKLTVFSENIKNSLMLGLISEWSFDDITQYDLATGVMDVDANVPDSWEARNNGTAKNQPILKDESECVIGKCIFFNGSNNYILVQYITTMYTTTRLTVEAWVNLESSSADYQCINSDSWTKWYIGFYPNGKTLMPVVRNTANSVVESGSTYALENYQSWHHIVMTIDQSKGIFAYVDGEKKVNAQTSFQIRQSSTNIQIGSDGIGVDSDYFHGKIDEVKLYADALSQAQIKQNYIAGLNSMLANGNISKEEYNKRISELASN